MDPINFERISLLSWPPATLHNVDGWSLGFTNGFTRRANSVYPLSCTGKDLSSLVDNCEDFYRSRGLRVTFKITTDPSHQELDHYLEKIGYTQDGFTTVMAMPLATWQQPVKLQSAGYSLGISETLESNWIDGLVEIGALAADNKRNLANILGAIQPPHCFATLNADANMVSAGLGVLSGDHLGLFDIFTKPDHRQRGLAGNVIASLIKWGLRLGAHTTWLQVVDENLPALGLYQKLGFKPIYRYWYRSKI